MLKQAIITFVVVIVAMMVYNLFLSGMLMGLFAKKAS